MRYGKRNFGKGKAYLTLSVDAIMEDDEDDSEEYEEFQDEDIFAGYE